MPFTALFGLIALLATAAIFLISLKMRGLKTALLFSAAGLVSFGAIFFVLLTLALNNM
jgi:hypothetical protein